MHVAARPDAFVQRAISRNQLRSPMRLATSRDSWRMIDCAGRTHGARRWG